MRWLPLLALGVAGLASTPAGAGPSPEKRALILEFLQLSGSRASAQRMANFYLLQLRGSYPRMVEEVVATETQLTPEERRTLSEHLSDFDSFASAFSARFPERIDLDAVFESVYVPLYDRHFNEEELRALVSFYASPVGRKTLAVMPALMQEGMEATLPLVEPRVQALVGEILGERRQDALE